MVATGLYVCHSSRRLAGLLLMVVEGSKEGGHSRTQGSLRPMQRMGMALFPYSVGQGKSWSWHRLKGVGDETPPPDGKSCPVPVQRVWRWEGGEIGLSVAQAQCRSFLREELRRNQGPGTVGCGQLCLYFPEDTSP